MKLLLDSLPFVFVAGVLVFFAYERAWPPFFGVLSSAVVSGAIWLVVYCVNKPKL